MFIRVFLAAAVALGLMVAVKNGHLLQRAGLVGSCRIVPTPGDQSGEWRACTSGRLEGRPDLSRNGCTRQSVYGRIEVWRCPAQLATS